MNNEWKKINVPVADKVIKSLRIGDLVLFSGIIYTARDKAHERLSIMYQENKKLPIDLNNQIIYYVGPSPKPEGKVIGSAGPTTSYRMDSFTEIILKLGVKGLIGKGKRDKKIIQLLQNYNALYLSSFGGAGAYLSKKIVNASIVAFEDLGPEAIYKLEVYDFPAIVVNDIFGGDLYENVLRNRK